MSQGAEWTPRRVVRTYTKVIHMPRWGVERVILKEATITLQHVSMIDGPLVEAGPADPTPTN